MPVPYSFYHRLIDSTLDSTIQRLLQNRITAKKTLSRYCVRVWSDHALQLIAELKKIMGKYCKETACWGTKPEKQLL